MPGVSKGVSDDPRLKLRIPLRSITDFQVTTNNEGQVEIRIENMLTFEVVLVCDPTPRMFHHFRSAINKAESATGIVEAMAPKKPARRIVKKATKKLVFAGQKGGPTERDVAHLRKKEGNASKKAIRKAR
jgi:hypothetical protein